LQQIKKILFADEVKPIHPPIVCPKHEYLLHHSLYPFFAWLPMLCLTVERDPKDPDDLEELRHLAFQESEGSRGVKDTILNDVQSFYTKPLKLRKVNIGTDEHPKLTSIGDYWDEQTVIEIQALLWEYEDLFPTNFSKLKSIKGDLQEIGIELKPESRPVKHRPYRLNPRVKEKVKGD
jgi:hypothetical protein